MACSTLEYSAEDLPLIFQELEVFCGVEGWFYAVGNGVSPGLGGAPPFLLPQFDDGAFGSALGVGSCGAERYLTSERGGFFG